MKRFIGFVAIGLLAGCVAPGSVGAVNESIINGTDDTGDPAVVMVLGQVPGSQSASLCTGTVISPHVIVTAAHCVDPTTVGTGAKFVVFTGDVLTNTAPQSDFLTVKETHFDMAFDDQAPDAGHDVGIVILASPTTITPLPYNRAAMAQSLVGQPVRVIGYGVTSGTDSMGTTAGTKRQTTTMLAHLDDILLGLQDGTHGICEGDSGGPAFMTLNGVEQLVGVTSFGITGCPLVPPTGAPPGAYAGNDTRLDTYAAFIDMWVTMFDPPPKGPGQACTSDADCDPLQCQQTSVGKICVQQCDPMVATSCPAGTTCTSVDGSNICAMPNAGGGGGGAKGGCAMTGGAPVGGIGFLFALVALVALRRRARA